MAQGVRILSTGWVHALLFYIAISTGSANGHKDDLGTASLLQAEELEHDTPMQRVNLDDGPVMSAKSYYNAGTFSYSIQLPDAAGRGRGDQLAESLGGSPPPRTLNLRNLRRVLSSYVTSDGTVERSRVLEAILHLTHDQSTQGLPAVSLLELGSSRSGTAGLRVLEQKLKERGLKPKYSEEEDAALSRPVSDEAQSALAAANEMHEKADKQLKMAVKQNEEDRAELASRHSAAHLEAAHKQRREKSIKKANEIEEKKNKKHEAAVAKKANAAEEMADKATKKAKLIKEILDKATEASSKSKAQETKSKETAAKFVESHQEERQKAIVMRHISQMATDAENDMKDQVDRNSKENAEKTSQEHKMKSSHAENHQKIDEAQDKLKEELASKRKSETLEKKTQEGKLKKNAKADKEAARKTGDKLKNEHKNKTTQLQEHQQKKAAEYEKAFKQANKEAMEQSNKKKERVEKAEEIGIKKVAKELADKTMENKNKNKSEANEKKEAAQALHRDATMALNREEKNKELSQKLVQEQIAKERMEKQHTTKRRQQTEKRLLGHAVRVKQDAVDENKAKIDHQKKSDAERKTKQTVTLRTTRAKLQEIEDQKKAKETDLKKSQVTLAKMEAINHDQAEKSAALAKASMKMTLKAKELGQKVQQGDNQFSAHHCRLKSFMDPLEENNLLGTLSKGDCKVSCQLDQNLAFGIKVPCVIEQGKGKERCQNLLLQRANSIALLGLTQYDKYAECLSSDPQDSSEEKQELGEGIDNLKQLKDTTPVKFATFMGEIQGLAHNGAVHGGPVIDLLLKPKNDLGEEPESTDALMNRMADEALKPRNTVRGENWCRTKIKIRNKLNGFVPKASKHCRVECTANVPTFEGFDVECKGSGDQGCFLDAQVQYHREVAEAWFAWKFKCMDGLDR